MQDESGLNAKRRERIMTTSTTLTTFNLGRRLSVAYVSFQVPAGA